MSQNPKNTHILTGYLAADPELTILPSGSVKAVMRVPVDRNYKDGEGNKITDWFNVECFGKLAELVGEYTKKGTLIQSLGSLYINNYEKDGVKHSRVVHNSSSVQFLGSRDSAGSGDSPRKQATGTKSVAKAKPAADADFAIDDDELPPF